MTYNVHKNNSVVEEQTTNLPNDPPKQKYYDQGRVIQTFLISPSMQILCFRKSFLTLPWVEQPLPMLLEVGLIIPSLGSLSKIILCLQRKG
jgi:hypothetical protein